MNNLESWLKEGLPIFESLTEQLNNIENKQGLTDEQKIEIEKLKKESNNTINMVKPSIEECIAQLNELRKKASL